jgi:hypothetical protein
MEAHAHEESEVDPTDIRAPASPGLLGFVSYCLCRRCNSSSVCPRPSALPPPSLRSKQTRRRKISKRRPQSERYAHHDMSAFCSSSSHTLFQYHRHRHPHLVTVARSESKQHLAMRVPVVRKISQGRVCVGLRCGRCCDRPINDEGEYFGLRTPIHTLETTTHARAQGFKLASHIGRVRIVEHTWKPHHQLTDLTAGCW